MSDLTPEQQDERDKLIIECMALGYVINSKSPFCVFVDFSGHVDSLSVEIAESKANYQRKLCRAEFNVTDKWSDVDLFTPNGWLKMKRDMLKEIAERHDIPLDSMERQVEHIYYHWF